MSRIARPIGRADLEFYEAALVMRTARSMAKKTEAEWTSLTRRTRQRWLDRALDVLSEVLGDAHIVERLPLLAANLMTRR